MSKIEDELEKIKRMNCPASCDGKGTYVGGVDQDGDPEPAQCQWCFEVGMPLEKIFATSQREAEIRARIDELNTFRIVTNIYIAEGGDVQNIKNEIKNRIAELESQLKDTTKGGNDE